MNDLLKPIRIFAFALIAIAAINCFIFARFFFFDSESPVYIFGNNSRFTFYIWSCFVTFNLVTAFGILSLKRWGYTLFKVYLYLLFLGFPIGTLISYFTLSYMKRHRIEEHFGRHLYL